MKKLILTSPSKYIFILLFFAVSLLESVPTITASQYLPIPDLESGEQYSIYLDSQMDNNLFPATCYIGFPNAETATPGYGKVYVYKYDFTITSKWFLEDIIVSSNLDENEHFGATITKSDNYLYISSSDTSPGNFKGAIHQYFGTHFISVIQRTCTTSLFGSHFSAASGYRNGSEILLTSTDNYKNVAFIRELNGDSWEEFDTISDDWHFYDAVAVSKTSQNGEEYLHMLCANFYSSSLIYKRYHFDRDNPELFGYELEPEQNYFFTSLGENNGVGYNKLIIENDDLYVGAMTTSEIPELNGKGKLHRYSLINENPEQYQNYENDFWPNVDIGDYFQVTFAGCGDIELVATSDMFSNKSVVSLYWNGEIFRFIPFIDKDFAMGWTGGAAGTNRISVLSVNHDEINQNYVLVVHYPLQIVNHQEVPENDLSKVNFNEENTSVQFTTDHSELDLTVSMQNQDPPNSDFFPNGISRILHNRYWRVSTTIPAG